jgi:thioredoxin 1
MLGIEKWRDIMAVINLTKENYETEVLQSVKPVLIDFWAAWCGPCQMLSPLVDELAEEREDIKVAKLNVDDEELSDVVMKFRVMSIPMLVVIKNGEETNRSIGVISKEEILALL